MRLGKYQKIVREKFWELALRKKRLADEINQSRNTKFDIDRAARR
jgi:hypothetical protein